MSAPALALSGVRLVHNPGRSDEVVALHGLDLEVARGEFVTVVGSNGAGKSSMVSVVSGATRPTTGRVRIDGRDVTRLPAHRRAGSVARVFDDPRTGTAPELSIEDNLALAARRGRRRGLRRAVGPKQRAEFRERLAELGLGLEDRMQDPVGLLSAGQRQSVTMVMVGLVAPSVLLLDEHLAALDPATAARVLRLTCALAERTEAAVLMVTHNMQHAIDVGDRLMVMDRGRLVADVRGPRKEQLTVDAVVDLITTAGGVVADRSLLAGTEER